MLSNNDEISSGHRLAGERVPSLLRDETLPDIFKATAARSPERAALILDGQTLDYAGLMARAERIALALRGRGAGRGSFVGLWMTRSLDLHAAMIGILLAGAAYIPFDADAPSERVSECLEDCGAAAILLDAATEKKAGLLPAAMLRADLLASGHVPAPDGPLSPAEGATPDDPAYAIYTSGSTGKPKGVVVSHRNICHYLRAANTIYGLTADDVVFQGCSVAFDLSLEEIWIPYLAGATLWVASQETMRETERLPDLLEAAGVTVLDTVPTLLSMLPRDVASLRLIILGGEACPPPLAARWARTGRRMFNSYGPTETTVVATMAEILPNQPVSIGRPIPNYSCYVVGEDLRPVPAGTEGELLVGGPGVTRGYLGRDDLTAQKFIANPFPSDGLDPILYRTGDAVSVRSDGSLDFHGRIDEQVKIRGFRVELGEIESRLGAFPGVGQAAVVMRRDGEIDRLVAFLVTEPGQEADRSRLRAGLRETLPCYMVPSCFEIVPDLPRLASGKVNRKALRTMPLSEQQPAEEAEEPGTQTEAVLLAAAKGLFPGQSLPLDADFFMDLGGHSLLAARFVSEVRKTPALAGITLQDVYDARTLRAMAAKLDQRAAESGPADARDLSFTPPPLYRRFLCGLAQAIALPFILALASAPWLGVLASYYFMPDEVTFWSETLNLLAVYTFFSLLAVAVSIVGKWAAIGRTKPGRYPLWGVYYFRWWLAHRFLALFHAKWLQGSPLMRIYLRALGARVGSGAIISDPAAGAIDLVTIGENATLGGNVGLGNGVVVGNELVIGSITIGDDAYIGTSCVLGPDVTIGQGAELADLTAVAAGTTIGDWELWDGSPARRVGMVDRDALPEPAVAGGLKKAFLCLVYLAAFLLLPPISLIPILPAFSLLERLDAVLNTSDPNLSSAWLPIIAWPTSMALIVATVAFIVAVRWIVLPRVRAGSYSIYGGFYVRKWIVAFLTTLTLETLTSLYATTYMRWWYRLMGARIGKDAEISVDLASRYDVIEIGEKCFIADEVAVGDEDIRRGWMTLKGVRTADRVFIGNNSVLPPGSDIQTGALIGIKSKPPTHESVASGDTWFGSPPIKLPVRQHFDNLTSSAWTYEPTRLRRLGRMVFEAFSVSFPIMLSITFGMIAVGHLEAAVETHDYFKIFTRFIAGSTGVAFALTGSAIVMKWLLMGVYKPMVKPMWSWWALRTESVGLMYTGMSGQALLEHMYGTPMLIWILRLFGCKFGQGCYLDTIDFTEFDNVHVGDYVSLNSLSALQTHLYEDRVMKIGRVTVGNGVSVGTFATVLYDTHVGDFARLGPLTVVMKGESIPPSSDWSGAPAAPTRSVAEASPAPAEAAVGAAGALPGHEPEVAAAHAAA